MRRCALFKPIAVMLLASYLGACYYYASPGDLGPEAYMAQKEPRKIRVTLTDSRQVTLTTPWITSDSVGGVTEDDAPVWDDELGNWVQGVSGPWAASRQQVSEIDMHRSDPMATTALVVLVAGVPLIVVIAYAVGCKKGGCD